MFSSKFGAFTWVLIWWAKNGVFRGKETAEGSNAKNGVYADARGAKKTNKKTETQVD